MSEEMEKELPADENLAAVNAALMAENLELAKQNDLLHKQHIRLEDQFGAERAKWKEERRILTGGKEELQGMVSRLSDQLAAAKGLRNTEKRRRAETASRLVIIAAVALVLLMVPCMLHKLCIIGPQLSFGIECGLMMVISWCYALIWDRTRK